MFARNCKSGTVEYSQMENESSEILRTQMLRRSLLDAMMTETKETAEGIQRLKFPQGAD